MIKHEKKLLVEKQNKTKLMIEAVKEYQDLLIRLRQLKAENKLSHSMKSKLEGLEECEHLIKHLGLKDVNHQRELLKNFIPYYREELLNGNAKKRGDEIVDSYLKNFN